MRANYIPMNKTKAHQIAQEEVNKMYQQIFAECAGDVMAQVLSNVLLTLERDYGWRDKRLTDFIHNLHGWVDIMQTPSEITDEWTTKDNIRYFADKYGIDLEKEFEPQISHN